MGSINDRKVIGLIESIYETSVSESSEGWVQVFDEFSRMVSSGPGSLALYSKTDDRFNVVASTVDPSFLKEYSEHYQFVSPFKNAIVNLREGAIFSRRVFQADDIYEKSSYYNEFSRRQDVFELEHHALYSKNGLTGGLSLSRPKHRPEFSADERRLIDIGVRHLRKAFSNYIELTTLRNRETLLSGILESAGCAVFVVDHQMKVVFANQNAELELNKKDLIRKTLNGEIAFRSQRATRVVRSAAARVNSVGDKDLQLPKDVLIGKRSDNSPISLNIAYGGKLPINGASGGRHLILYLHSPFEPIDSIDSIAYRHGLTAAEIRVTKLLVAGNNVKAICDNLAISNNTVRSHLKNIFAKTGTNRQAELVRLILS